MKNLTIQKTQKTPFVEFSYENNHLSFKGASFPENAISFFSPICDWVSEYTKKTTKPTTVFCQISYLNTSSIQFFYTIFSNLEKLVKKASVTWICLEDDIDTQETCKDFQDVFKINFDLILVQDFE